MHCVSAVSFVTTNERRQVWNGEGGGSSVRQTPQTPAMTPAVARQMALIRRAVDAAWSKCRKAKSLRELAACIDAQPRQVGEIMRAQLLYELNQLGIPATWRDVKEGKAAAEAVIALLSRAQPGGP